LKPYNRFVICLKAVRAQFFSASLIPILLAAVLAQRDGASFLQWNLLPLFALAVLLMHSGTNLINDYYDFRQGVDKAGTFGSGCALVEGLISPRQARIWAYLCFLAAFVSGLFLAERRGPLLLWMGLAGFLGGYGYTGKPFGLKYFGLGEFLVFPLMGPLLVLSAYFTLTGRTPLNVVYAALPVGLLVTAILHSNNLRDIVSDREAGIRTMALSLGFQGAKAEYYFLVFGAYLSIPALWFFRIVPAAAFLTWLTLPAAAANAASVRAAAAENPAGLARIDIRTAGLHLVFGMLYILSFYTAAALRAHS